MILIAQLHLLCTYIIDKQVWDIDTIRSSYTNTAYTMYIRGCMKGVNEYPQEYRKEDHGFNVNSPTNWCYDQGQDQSVEIDGEASNLGRLRK
jgi:hypothetical protein